MLWQRIQSRLQREPERRRLNEHRREWMRHVMGWYGKFEWDETVSNGKRDLQDTMRDILAVAQRRVTDGPRRCRARTGSSADRGLDSPLALPTARTPPSSCRSGGSRAASVRCGSDDSGSDSGDGESDGGSCVSGTRGRGGVADSPCLSFTPAADAKKKKKEKEEEEDENDESIVKMEESKRPGRIRNAQRQRIRVDLESSLCFEDEEEEKEGETAGLESSGKRKMVTSSSVAILRTASEEVLTPKHGREARTYE